MKKYMFRENDTVYYYKIIDGKFKGISPMHYMKLDCEDITSDYNTKECYLLLKNKIQFNKLIEISQEYGRENYKELLLACNTILYTK